MAKIFLVILYIYTAWHIFAFSGQTAEVTVDEGGKVIQQLYDRHGNMTGIYDIKGEKLKETEYTFDGDIISETTYENGRVVKETEYEPCLKPEDTTFIPEEVETFEYIYTPGSTEVQVVLSITQYGITATDSIVYNMQSEDNYVRRGAFSSWGSETLKEFNVQLHSVTEVGPDYEIKAEYNSDGTVEISDSRDKEKE